MSFLSNERGVSEVLGAILVFALVLSVLVIIQVAGVPAANQQIEFEHNARVQEDFQAFDQNVDRAAALGAESSVAVETGVRYPPRLFLINPGPAAGTLTTSEETDVTFRHVSSINPETNDFFNGTVTYEKDTTTLTYRPSYNEYGTAPSTNYEHGVIYNSDPDGKTAVVANGNLIDGNRISLTLVQGALSESSTKSVTLGADPVSAPSQTVSIRASPNSNPNDVLELELYTGLSEDTWREILDGEFTPDGYVDDIECPDQSDSTQPCGRLVISLLGTDPSNGNRVAYDVRLAKVGVGSDYTAAETSYLTKPSLVDPEINLGGTSLTVQVRDEFNNPVSGVPVTFSTTSTGEFATSGGATDTEPTVTVTSDENGEASAVYVPGVGEDEVDVTATADLDNNPGTALPRETVQFADLSVDTSETTDLTEGDLNPAGDGFVVQQAARLDGSTIEVDFENRAGGPRTIVQARINFYFVGSQSGSQKDPVTGDLVTTNPDETLYVAGDYEILSDQITMADGETVTLEFSNWQQSGGNGVYDPKDQDFFVLTLFFSNDADDEPEERGVYIVGARSTGSVSTGPSNPPTASITDVTKTLRQNGRYDVTVDWSATDDIELSGGTINEVRLSNGATAQTEPISPSGTADSGSVTFTNINGDPTGWTVELEVSDSNDQQVTATDTVP